ncbi:MAG TPA: hypothetical protein VIV06_08740 [Candidatus Limnocylindrales bacterium]
MSELGASFGRVREPDVVQADFGPNGDAVHRFLERCHRLTFTDLTRLSDEAGWRWWALTLPVGGPLAVARATAITLGRRAGRTTAVSAAQEAARAALATSGGWLATAGQQRRAEAALSSLLFGALIVVGGVAARQPLAIVIGAALVILGLALAVLAERGFLVRRRASACVEAAALGLVVRDLIEPDTFGVLCGPWSGAIHTEP